MSNIDKMRVGSTTYDIADSTSRSSIGDLTQLNTTDKSSLVGAINEAMTTGGSSGLTNDIKEALLDCFEHVAWIDENGQDYYDALHDALYPPANLTSITCVYTQSGTVYDTDTLDSLKTDLVVTAHYDDSSTQTVTTYTLSGALTVGTSTITVLYGGESTTFTVTVTHYQAPINYLYNWDFTTSLIDSVNSKEATLHTTTSGNLPTQDSSGLHFTEAGQIVKLFKNDVSINLCGKTIEVDVASMDIQFTEQHIRFLMISAGSGNGNGLMYRDGENYYYWGFYGTENSTWSDAFSAELTGNTTAVKNAFSGKTVKLVFDSSGYPSLYVDDVYKGTSTQGNGTAATSYRYITLGGTTKATSCYCYNTTITAVRIYETV